MPRLLGPYCPGDWGSSIFLVCRFSVSAVQFFYVTTPIFEFHLVFSTAFAFLKPNIQPFFSNMPSTKKPPTPLSNDTGGAANGLEFAVPATPAAGGAISAKPPAGPSKPSSMGPPPNGPNSRRPCKRPPTAKEKPWPEAKWCHPKVAPPGAPPGWPSPLPCRLLRKRGAM